METPVKIQEELVNINLGDVTLEGMLAVPQGSQALVLFAHGSGNSRLSPRNNFVARELQKTGLGTLLFDLLTKREDEVYRTRGSISSS